MIVDRITELYRYIDGRSFEIIRDFVKDTYEMDYAEGIYILGEGIYASVSSYMLIDDTECKVEVHRHHIDIQATLWGAEGISIFDRKDLGENEDYDEDKDVSFPPIIKNRPIVRIINSPGYFSLIYPNEPHRPKEWITGESRQVKKFVIKIDTSLNL